MNRGWLVTFSGMGINLALGINTSNREDVNPLYDRVAHRRLDFSDVPPLDCTLFRPPRAPSGQRDLFTPDD